MHPSPTHRPPVSPGHRPVLGILGGGQLAKMTALAAYPLGISVAVLDRRAVPGEPIVGWRTVTGDWDDPDVLLEFARDVDVVSLENEFVAADALAALEDEGHRLVPSSECIRLVQDKLVQKQTLSAAGLPLPAFRAVQHAEDVIDAARELGWPLVLKRRTLGYDGKGNATLRAAADLPAAWQKLGGDHNALYVEQFCTFEREVAVIVTRAAGGDTVVYPVVDTVQRDHICHTVTAPARLAPAQAEQAADLGRRAAAAIQGVGSIGIEMFLMPDGALLINELAPRVHNSGHYSIEACLCSQFENHARAVLGWPLGSPALRAPAAAMVNLLGAGDGPAMPDGLAEALAVPGAHVHIYGKERSVKSRKMGHVTALGASIEEALATAQRAAACLRFGA
jgi:5-(carboxyamino)imidazole ribonucleotide synthase